MFGTICFDHRWTSRCLRSVPKTFSMYYCSRADCNWCELKKTLFTYKRNKIFIRKLALHTGHLEILTFLEREELQEQLKFSFINFSIGHFDRLNAQQRLELQRALKHYLRVRKLFIISE